MKRFFLPLIIVILLVSFFRLGSVTLFDVDEAVFAQASKEMVQGGDWITPHYNGEIRYDKPILIYWLMAASYAIFGINEFGARFPSAVAGVLLAVCLFFFMRRHLGDKGGLIAALTLVLSPYFFVYTHASVTDMTLTLFISLSLLSFYRWTQTGTDSLSLYGFYLFSALAFLTKGLIGIIFPFGTALIYLALRRTEDRGQKSEVRGRIKEIGSVISLRGIILFLAASAPWYLVQFSVNGWEFIDQFFIKHHFKRFTAVNSGHEGPLYFYLITLFAGMFPWIAFFPSGIREAIRRIRSTERGSFSDLPLFSLIWFCFVFIFFSFSTTKLPNYILPSIPAVAILISWGVMEGNKKWNSFALGFIGLLSALLGAGSLIAQGYLEKMSFEASWLPALAVVLFLFTVTAIVSLVRRRTLYIPMAVTAGLFLLILSVKALPVAADYLQGTLHRYSLIAKERLGEGERLIIYGLNNPSILFYSDHMILDLKDKTKLASAGNGKHAIAICKAKDRELLMKAGFRVIEEDGKYAILERD
jgi:4-amino-4-deoxy-L-arabinose transferase-like glycosyltransferase